MDPNSDNQAPIDGGSAPANGSTAFAQPNMLTETGKTEEDTRKERGKERSKSFRDRQKAKDLEVQQQSKTLPIKLQNLIRETEKIKIENNSIQENLHIEAEKLSHLKIKEQDLKIRNEQLGMLFQAYTKMLDPSMKEKVENLKKEIAKLKENVSWDETMKKEMEEIKELMDRKAKALHEKKTLELNIEAISLKMINDQKQLAEKQV